MHVIFVVVVPPFKHSLCSSGCTEIYYADQAIFDLVILLPLHPGCWDKKCHEVGCIQVFNVSMCFHFFCDIPRSVPHPYPFLNGPKHHQSL